MSQSHPRLAHLFSGKRPHVGSVARDTGHFVLFQVNSRNIEENAFWVKTKEYRFEDDAIFKGLVDNFASKAPGTKARFTSNARHVGCVTRCVSGRLRQVLRLTWRASSAASWVRCVTRCVSTHVCRYCIVASDVAAIDL